MSQWWLHKGFGECGVSHWLGYMCCFHSSWSEHGAFTMAWINVVVHKGIGKCGEFYSSLNKSGGFTATWVNVVVSQQLE